MEFEKAALNLLPVHPKFRVFPLYAGTKIPAIKGFPSEATRDPEKIRNWAKKFPHGNVGIATDEFAVLDVDNKGDGKGSDELLRFELEGKAIPETLEQRTPTGGLHLFYEVDEPVRNSIKKVGRWLDIRGKGGYVVGAGSVVEAGTYTIDPKPVSKIPEWLRSVCHQAKAASPLANQALPGVDPAKALERAKKLLAAAPGAIEGQGGDGHTYGVVCDLKDTGVSALTAFELLLDHWNEKCQPPWSPDELARKVENAYRYGIQPIGVAAPEVQFPDLPEEEKKLHPFEVLNKEYAYVLGQGSDYILHETKDERGRFLLKHIDIDAFHRSLASRTMSFNQETHAVSKLWIRDQLRRSYDGLCFLPGKEAPARFYNLWRGFAVTPLGKDETPTSEAKKSVDQFLEHAFENVCEKDQKLHRWLIGYFAHLIQKPWQKPMVALVMKGRKGVGKNALLERVGHLLGDSFMVISNRRHLTGNFNSLLENKLMLVFSEAFWSGDKQAEGILKELITGEHHLIERKGKEPYQVVNCLRATIIGNEDWLVPATEDERRFAVFNVGEGRMQDGDFFESMRLGLEAGGYRYLLRYLLDFDLSGIRVSEAPQTKGLLEQKEASLGVLAQWWKDCLYEGKIQGSDFGDGWPSDVSKERFRASFARYVKERNVGGRLPNAVHFGRSIKKFLPSLQSDKQIREEGEKVNVYGLPTLDVARFEWEEFIGQEVFWEKE
jgi:hypothetical protein